MKKLGVYFLVAMLMVSFVFASTGIQVYASVVGDQLLESEDGWRRYEEDNALLYYLGDGWTNKDNEGYQYYTNNPGDSLKMKFYGSKFRFIGTIHSSHSKNVIIKIDNDSYNFNQYHESDNGIKNVLQFEKLNLTLDYHTVEISSTETIGPRIAAIDIDEEGYLIDINTPTNLTAKADDEEVNLSWDEVEGAESYIVKRSETKGGEYKEIGETKETSYTDSGLENGTTYYYVVIAVKDEKESSPSNEASATPEGDSSSGSGDNALLRITMSNGKINEYDLSMSDVEDFIDWYEDRANDRGKPYYIMEKNYNIGPFESRKDYIAFDKILQFEVMEYNK